VGILKQHKIFDREGIVIGDTSYLFVADNENCEGSVKVLFCKHNHPVDGNKLIAAAGCCQWERSRSMLELLIAPGRCMPGNRV
jgi:hypothetical protein